MVTVTEQTLQSPPVELDPYQVELTRGMKGQYGWTVTIKGKDMADLMGELRHADDYLKATYLTEPTKGG